MLRKPFKRRLAAALLFAALSGCATNALRVDYARTVGEQGKETAAASREFLRRVDLARREANIELVAADPACGLDGGAKVRQRPRILAKEARGWLCVPPGWRRDDFTLYSLQPLTPELEPTFDLISALASYAEALTEIVDRKAPDPMKPLLDALATARAVQGTIQAIRNREGGPIPAEDDDRVKAVSGFVGLLTELSHEADQVRVIREVLKKHPRGVEAVTAALRADLRDWEESRDADASARLLIIDAIRDRAVQSNPPVSIGDRREAIVAFHNLQDERSAAAKIHPALDAALVELDTADKDLRRIIVENPNLNAKEKARVAELNRQRIVRALQRVTALITSFRGG
jgi:hypothetical protein